MDIKIILSDREFNYLKLIVNGLLKPLEGFMNKNEYENCIIRMMLPNKDIFPSSITISIDKRQKEKLLNLREVNLVNINGINIATLEINHEDECIYNYDWKFECNRECWTLNMKHPYVKEIKNIFDSGKIFHLGGKISWFNEEYIIPKIDRFLKHHDIIIGIRVYNRMVENWDRIILNYFIENNITNAILVILMDPKEENNKLLDIDVPGKTLVKILNVPAKIITSKECIMDAIILKNYGCTHILTCNFHGCPEELDNCDTDEYHYLKRMSISDFKDSRRKIDIKLLFLNESIYKSISYKIDKNTKIIFSHLPKCGGITIEKVLRDQFSKAFRSLRHNQIENKIEEIKYIGNIRNPFSWYVSMWAFSKNRIFQNSELSDDLTSIENFRKWLNLFIYDNQDDLMDYQGKYRIGALTRTYFELYNSNNNYNVDNSTQEITVDYFIHCETIFEDIEKIFGIRLEEVKLNTTNHLQYREYYDEDTKELIYDRERYIFKNFNYSF